MSESEKSFIKNINIAHDTANSGKPLRDAAREDGVIEERKHFLDTQAEKVENMVENTLNPFGVEELRKMFGENFYGPEKIEEKLGIKIPPEDIPPVPPQEKVIKAEKLGMVCILRVYESGKPAEWKFIMPNILPETADKDYVEQIRVIRDFLKSYDLLSAEELEECSHETLDNLKKAWSNDVAVVRSITGLKINKNHRSSYLDMVYYATILSEVNEHKERRCRKLGSSFEATNETTHLDSNRILLVGRFDDQRSFNHFNNPTEDDSVAGLKDSLEEYDIRKLGSRAKSWGSYYKQGVRVVI